MKKMLLAAAAATAFVSTAAIASVTLLIDEDGIVSGFVGKGDVQSPFGLNNAKMQANADKVTFHYSDIITVTFTCRWTTGPDHNLTVHNQNFTRSGGLQGTIFGDPRKTGQWTGWNVSGALQSVGNLTSIPQVGDPCPGNQGNGKEVVSVDDAASSGETLTATIPGLGSREIPITPTI